MTSIAATSNTVLKQFIAGANAQYREAGLGDYQMRIGKDGLVTVPSRPAPNFSAPDRAGSAAPEQAAAGAPTAGAAQAPPTAPAPAAAIRRSGPAPTVSDLQQGGADAFRMAWKPVQGARQYGVWQDGTLIGHVTSPAFAGKLAPGASGTIQIDAVRADGTRTELTRALRVTRSKDDKITFDVPGAPAPAAAATAAAAPAG